MFWSRPAFRSALKITATGAVVTTVTTVSSCALAIVIEGAAHRTLYRFFPHWYKDVKYAYGLDLHLRNNSDDASTLESATIRAGGGSETMGTIARDGERIAADNSLAGIEARLRWEEDDATTFDTYRSSGGDKADEGRKGQGKSWKQDVKMLRSGGEEISQQVFAVAMTG